MRVKNEKELFSGEKSSNPHRLNYYILFWIFFLGCFLGVVAEFLYFMFAQHNLQIRAGVLYGPFNPVYGFGAVLMTVCLKWLSDKHFLWIFLGSTLLGGLFEYLCSALQELVIGTVSWDYSDTFLNINGRTSLLHALIWGVLGTIWIKWVYHHLAALINRIPHIVLIIVTIVLSIFMALNMLLSYMAVDRQSERRAGIPAENAVDCFFDQYYPDEYLDRVYLSTIAVAQN